MLARSSDLSGVCAQALHHVAVIGPQRGGQLPITASEVNDYASFNPGGGQDLPSRFACRFCERNLGRPEGHQHKTKRRGPGTVMVYFESSVHQFIFCVRGLASPRQKALSVSRF